jgi:hypothetical protein
MISTLNVGARYFGMFLLCAGPFVGLNVSSSILTKFGRANTPKIHIPWETSNVARPRTKRAALVAITNCIASVSHWFSPYFFVSCAIYFSSRKLTILATISGAPIHEWWRLDHRGLRPRYHRLLSLPLVLYTTQQATREGRGEEQSAKRLEIRTLSSIFDQGSRYGRQPNWLQGFY